MAVSLAAVELEGYWLFVGIVIASVDTPNFDVFGSAQESLISILRQLILLSGGATKICSHQVFPYFLIYQAASIAKLFP